jgi:hypothetical protein
MPRETPRSAAASISALEDYLGQLEEVDHNYLYAEDLSVAIKRIEEIAATAIRDEADDKADDEDEEEDLVDEEG